MRDSLVHRGPDGAGEVALRSADRALTCWLGHRRLKVLDVTEAADQPMLSDDGLVALSYNGEIYNFRELRTELQHAGHRFRSTGDTEVVLRAYQQWGEQFVSRLDGMFALAIWDARSARLLLARDRPGKKPLYYSNLGGRFTFGSEIKAILAAPWVKPQVNIKLLPEFLTFGYAPHPHTMFEGIYQVPPASVVTFDAEGLHEAYPYWDPIAERQDLKPTKATLRRVVDLLDEATQRRLISDVPLGVFLSGGIDSSLVVALMCRSAAGPVQTFSIGFPDEPSFDERKYARLVAEHFGTDHTEYAVKADAVALMDTLLWHHDQPYADSSAIPTFLLSQLAREKVTVVLNGDGGDEVFGGYDRFSAVAAARLVPRFSAGLARRAAALLPVDHGYYSRARRAQRFFEFAELAPEARYQSWISVINEDLLRELLDGSVLEQAKGDSLSASMDSCYRRAKHLPLLDRVLYANFKTYLPDDLAPKMDRMSMANSLETRSPFLDVALVEYLARLPARHKVGLRHLKPVLRRACWDLLPQEIWNRKKHGFGVPMGVWFRQELCEIFEDEVLAADARIGDFVRLDVLRTLWDEHQTGRSDHGARFWTLLTLEHWMRTLGQPQSPPPTAAVIRG